MLQTQMRHAACGNAAPHFNRMDQDDEFDLRIEGHYVWAITIELGLQASAARGTVDRRLFGQTLTLCVILMQFHEMLSGLKRRYFNALLLPLHQTARPS